MNSSLEALGDVIRGFYASIVVLIVLAVGCVVLAPSSETPADLKGYPVPGDGSEWVNDGFSPDPVAVRSVYEDRLAITVNGIQRAERALARLFEQEDSYPVAAKQGAAAGDIAYYSSFWADEHPRPPAGWEEFDRLFTRAMAKYDEGSSLVGHDPSGMFAKFNEAHELLRQAQKVLPE